MIYLVSVRLTIDAENELEAARTAKEVLLIADMQAEVHKVEVLGVRTPTPLLLDPVVGIV